MFDRLLWRGSRTAIAALALICCIATAAAAGQLGGDKFDLALQYLNPQAPALAKGFRRVRIAMAAKAIADAHDAGLRFLRVAVSGYAPVNFGDAQNDLAQWQNDPSAYWAALDRMFADLDRAGVGLVPTLLWQISQFAVLGHNTLHQFVSDPDCRGRQLFAQYLRQFIGRYKNRKTILFYELTNEMNLAADLDLSGNCPKGRAEPCVADHFSTAEMNRFAAATVALIKRLDPSREVTSGYAIPRPAAWHLMRHPGYAPGGPDWTADTPAQFRAYMDLVDQPFDIVSVHIYPGRENVRFGRRPGDEYKLVDDAAAAAQAENKPLFVGEFGDAGPTPFMTRLLHRLVRDRVAYAAVWAWEFYQFSTFRTHDSEADRFSLEPGDDEPLLRLLMTSEAAMGAPPPAADPRAKPRVVLTWPLPCAAIDKPIALYAVASAGAGAVRSVEFLVDRKPIATATAFPYAAQFDPAPLGRRLARIDARATAPSGAVADFSSAVRLNGADAACPGPR